MSKMNCELCNKPARMFCESDQASLCFHCDEKVHAANFLVAKHSRTLLCHVCRSPTAWSAHGPKLGPTVSVCHVCSNGRRGGNTDNSSHHSVAGGDITAASTSNCREGIEDDELYSQGSDDQYDDDDDSFYDSEEGENQVVPWSEGDGTWHGDLEVNEFAKRAREYDAFESEDEDGCSSSQHTTETNNNSFQVSDGDSSELRPSKIQRRNDETMLSSSSGTAAIIDKLQSFQQAKPLS